MVTIWIKSDSLQMYQYAIWSTQLQWEEWKEGRGEESETGGENDPGQYFR